MFGLTLNKRYGNTMPMKYPDGFVSKIKAEYGGYSEICQAVDKGHYSLGKYLADEANKLLTPEEIITAFNNGYEKEILNHAHTVLRRKSIHADWIRLMVDKIASLDKPSNGNGRSKMTSILTEELSENKMPIDV
jgi:hypothetical protein